LQNDITLAGKKDVAFLQRQKWINVNEAETDPCQRIC